ncbi:MAG: acetyl-CoA carboxylase, biotin carboxyl carrier protein, partial [Anaerotignum sp.]|nr:acetyl-CoA carboxylase, biotin carboxyl carrier protein [Anaerotignum sp.]
EKTAPKAGIEQKSPLVGTVYLAPRVGAEPFVKVGDQVKKGDVLCIVESMKMFNNIEAELDGTIEAVCVDNGQVVEFGKPLVCILP